jgi:hypothetical protein
MPFEFSVGYMIDMNSPESGSNHAAFATPSTSEPAKQSKMARPHSARAVFHSTRASSQAPRKRPAARNTKKIVSAYTGSQAIGPS